MAKHFLYTAYTTSKVDIKLHLQLIALHDRILLLLQLLHVPRNIDIPSRQPLSLRCSKPHNGVRGQFWSFSENVHELFRNLAASCHFGEDVAGVDGNRRDALRAVLGVDELRKAEDCQFGWLVCG